MTSAAHQLCEAPSHEGAVISPKSMLEPVPELDWLGKHLVLSGEGRWDFSAHGGLGHLGGPLGPHGSNATVSEICT